MRKLIPFSALAIALITGGYFAVAQQGGGIQGGSSTPSGSTYAIQYNNAGSLGGTGPGTAGQILTSNGAGSAPTFQAAAGGTPGGANTQVQFNNAGAFGGDAGMTYNAATDSLTVVGTMAAGTVTGDGSGLSALDAGDISTGTLAVARGGTNLGASADDNMMIGNGTTWETKSIPDCQDSGGNHLNYTASTNTISCGTTGGGGGTTGTFETTWDATCTTAESQTWNYATSGNVVTLRMVDELACTADVVSFSADAGSVPLAIRPPATVVFPDIAANDNGVTITDRCVVLLITSAGTISVRRGASAGQVNCNGTAGGGWTASGTRNLLNGSNNGPATFTYILN